MVDKLDVILSIIVSLVSGGGILGFLLWKHQSRIQQRAKANEKLTEKRIESLEKIIEFEKKADIIEFLNIVHPQLFGSSESQDTNQQIIYMSIMEDRENLKSFCEELSGLRRNEEKWVSCKVAAYLLYAEKYILNFLNLLKEMNYTENDLYTFGIILAPDIQKWQRAFDKILIEELNKLPLTNEAHTGEEWEYQKDKLQVEYENSILYGIIHKENLQALELLARTLLCYAKNVQGNINEFEEAIRYVENKYNIKFDELDDF